MNQFVTGYSVRKSPAGGAFSLKYPALAHIPFIIDSESAYHRLANRFLIERGLGVWHPKSRLERRAWRIPSPISLKCYAEWLVNFLEWAERRGIDFYTCDYDVHILGRYQPDMIQGRWSRNGKSLANSSVNYRVSQACDYLVWLHDRKFRPPFDVPYRLVEVAIRAHLRAARNRTKTVKVRVGGLKQRIKALRMPSDNALRTWLAAIYERFGLTIGLVCETVLLTAMRREEVVSLPEDVISKNRADWVVINPERPEQQRMVKISICEGTKGEWFGHTNHGTKKGPEREINIPLSLAEKWHEYRRNQRISSFAAWMHSIPRGTTKRAHAARAACLFLKDQTGEQFSGQSLYAYWKGVPLPVPGWSVHDGRNWWACAKLWKRLKSRLSTLDIESDDDLAILTAAGKSTIDLEIKPQLGHIDSQTTERYLKWLVDMVATPVTITESALD